MIEFSRAQLTHAVAHLVGNKGQSQELLLSANQINFSTDAQKETFLKYLLGSFKTDRYYEFKGKIDVSLNSVANIAEDMFKTQSNFIADSALLAAHLHNQTMHPKTPGGLFYVCFFKDVIVDGELVNCIGLFKTEKQQTYLKVNINPVKANVDLDEGIDVNTLDKGCLVYNTCKDTGYKLSIVDKVRKADSAFYWQHDFLNAQLKVNSYYKTNAFIDLCRSFVDERTEELNELQRLALLNKSTNYFTEVVDFNQAEFEKQVLIDDELIDNFKEFKKEYETRLNIPEIDNTFEVSTHAIKENKKHMRQVIKLDSNFHIYVHANPQLLEKGYDEEKGQKYYKLYFTNED